MKEISLINLIAETRESIKYLNHSQSTQWQFDYAWRGLHEFFTKHKTTQFSEELANQYVMSSRQEFENGLTLEWKFKLIRKSINMLMQCYESDNVKWIILQPWGKTVLKEPIFKLTINDYVNQLKEKDYGHGTIEVRKTVSIKFLSYLEQEGFRNLSELGLNNVRLFVPYVSNYYQPSSMCTVFSALRSFLAFINEEKLTSCDLTRAIPNSFARKTTIIPTITLVEEDKLIATIDRETVDGKRTYAILLLSLRLGLRAVDIVNLKLENIKWKTNTIEIIQQKTKHQLIIPLLADVGNAIIDYLLNSRPKSQEAFIFLRMQAPYIRLSGHSSIYKILSRYMKKAGIRQSKGERKGSHCLRHTVAARLLAAETPLPIISSILGHANKNSTKVYLSTDLEHLQACALGLEGIEVTKEELLQ